MYELTKKPYTKFIKKGISWNIKTNELLQYNQESLGFHLGCFLLKYNFEMQPKLEEHDIFHVLTNIEITVPDEIAMQYYLLGNGNKSIYLIMVIIVGSFFYPTQIRKFKENYSRGKLAHRIYDLDFQKMLKIPVTTIRKTFNIK